MICNLSYGVCCPCYKDGCGSWFHTSCGIISGFDFQIDRQQDVHRILIYCKNHCNAQEEVRYVIKFNKTISVKCSDTFLEMYHIV